MASALLAAGAVPRRVVLLVLLLAALVLGGAAALRSTEYDETYTRLVTGPVPRPHWPTTPFTPSEAAAGFEAVVGPAAIARQLRETDVHPPLYFWLAGAWRAAGGTSVEALRALSVLLSVGAVAAFMAAARAAALPAVATGLATALAYGFAYTGGVARGFALAHLLLGVATLCTVLAWKRRSLASAALAGLAAGGASFTNYLAVFPAGAVLGWLLIAPVAAGVRLRLLAAAAVPFLLAQLGNLSFFMAQRGSRPDQFDAFDPIGALVLLGQFNAANLFGGLPLYAEGLARPVLAAALAALLAICALAVALRWQALGPTRWLWLGGFVAPSAGLLLLGAVFGTMPIELRYLAFAAPFAGAMLAGAAAGWARAAPRLAPAALLAVLIVQAAGAIGMALHPATQQTYRHALRAVGPLLGPGTLLLVPHGNDGVGIVGGVLAEAPRDQPLLVIRADQADGLPAQTAAHARLVLLGITDRDGAVQAAAARSALAADPRWGEARIAWRDARRGFAAWVYEARRSGAADGRQGVVVGRAHDGREEP
ncbi:hypothetical protein [Falsiroseomonas oryziterrae]|uniref:hypothetical protein n=1 Tax=Falsiroseomonas oryziterrae TaxID=2911368 RepID=UPI001F368DDE|nr:hypothetical protein [Roseomonas sp. NPKOSM-4]